MYCLFIDNNILFSSRITLNLYIKRTSCDEKLNSCTTYICTRVKNVSTGLATGVRRLYDASDTSWNLYSFT